MTDGGIKKIFVLTDTPGIYGDALNREDSLPVFVKDAASLISRIMNEDSGGLVLEVGKVMKAQRQERDRLFAFTSAFPVLRTRINARNGYVDYLDCRDAFFSNLNAVAVQKMRNHERKQVELPCFISREDDPSMAEPVEATIFDISPGGCFACTLPTMKEESFVHFRIPALDSIRPIYSSVRWSKPNADDPASHCMGIMFIDPTEAQIDSIKKLPPFA